MDNEARNLQLLRKIESLGGYAGCKSNPESFGDLLAELDPAKTEEQLNQGKHWAKHAKNENVRKMLPFFQNTAEGRKERVLHMLQGIEKLGGSAGYQKHLENSRFNQAAPPPVPSGWTSCYATGVIAAAVVVTAVTIYAEDYTGSGYAWGAGVGVGWFSGDLEHASWSELMSATNDFWVEAGLAQCTMWFYINGYHVATLVSVDLGAIATAGFDGDVDWDDGSGPCIVA